MRYYIGLIFIAVVMSFSTGYLALYTLKAPRFLDTPPPSLTELKQAFRTNHLVQREIDLERTELLDPASKLPQSFDYSYKSIRALFRYAESCKAPLKRNRENDPLAKAWRWQAYVCGARKTLPGDFFLKPPFFHPSGSSFAWMAYQSGKAPFQSDTWLKENLRRFHVTEAARISPLPSGYDETVFIASLGSGALSALAHGADAVLNDRYFLLRSNKSDDLTSDLKYAVYPLTDLTRFLTDSPYTVSVAKPDSTCFHREGNLCWRANLSRLYRRENRSLTLLFLGALLLTAALIVLLLKKIHEERRVDRAQRFALQTLTHELRTPITSMIVSMENIRKRFDSLDPEIQDAFLGNCDDLQRLKRLTEASTQYLKLGSSKKLIHFQIVEIDSLNAFIESSLEPYSNKLKAELLAEDIKARFDPYWLNICLKNLVENAVQHGSPPILVRGVSEPSGFQIVVEDHGRNECPELSKMTEPFRRSEKSVGLGLGLSIVHQIMKEMGGELRYVDNPTCFSLVLPIEAKKK
jgi:signal transduction histidine kinase